jgi:hypothetical protein
MPIHRSSFRKPLFVTQPLERYPLHTATAIAFPNIAFIKYGQWTTGLYRDSHAGAGYRDNRPI